MSDLIRSCFARAKTSLSLYSSRIILMYLCHRIVVFSFKIRSWPPWQQWWQVKEQDHDDNLSPSDKNQDKEEEHEDEEGLFDVLYSNRSDTAEGHTTKGILTLGGGFLNLHSANCHRRHNTSKLLVQSCGVLVFERSSGMYSLAVLSSSKWQWSCSRLLLSWRWSYLILGTVHDVYFTTPTPIVLLVEVLAEHSWCSR